MISPLTLEWTHLDLTVGFVFLQSTLRLG